jgi:hypothetical protein
VLSGNPSSPPSSLSSTTVNTLGSLASSSCLPLISTALTCLRATRFSRYSAFAWSGSPLRPFPPSSNPNLKDPSSLVHSRPSSALSPHVFVLGGYVHTCPGLVCSHSKRARRTQPESTERMRQQAGEKKDSVENKTPVSAKPSVESKSQHRARVTKCKTTENDHRVSVETEKRRKFEGTPPTTTSISASIMGRNSTLGSTSDLQALHLTHLFLVDRFRKGLRSSTSQSVLFLLFSLKQLRC